MMNPIRSRHAIGRCHQETDPTYSYSPFWLVLLVPLIVATICGLWNGLLVAYGKIQPMVATLILMICRPRNCPTGHQLKKIQIFYRPFVYIGNGWLLLPFSLYIAAFVFALAWLLTRRTSLGLFIESVGINSRSSLFSGIDEKKIKLFAYMFCGFCAGMAGMIGISNISTSDANQYGPVLRTGRHPGSGHRRNLDGVGRAVFPVGQRHRCVGHAGCHHFHVLQSVLVRIHF